GGADINGGGSSAQMPFGREWATASTDQRHSLTLAVVYTLPKLTTGNAVARAIVNGWGFNSIFQYISGTHLNVTQSQDGENNANGAERPDLVSGQSINLPDRTILKWFNTAA